MVEYDPLQYPTAEELPETDFTPWIPEISLGIGRGQGTYRAWTREWLYWYDQNGNWLSTPAEVAERLAEQLQQMGVDPDRL